MRGETSKGDSVVAIVSVKYDVEDTNRILLVRRSRFANEKLPLEKKSPGYNT